MKILVTGGAGYIGSHACKALAASGFEPVTYDNLSRGNRWAVKWGPLEIGDIADPARFQAVLDAHRPAAVIHFAAFAYVGESVENPNLYYQNNVCGSAALLRTVTQSKPIPVVFSSTCATYGVPDKVPITEDHPQRPINPYGFGKLVIERVLADLDTAHGLRSVSLRYFNAAGADPEGQIGEAHNPETHLIPLVLGAARDGTAITVFGHDYETPDGTCIRDYVHVADLADAHVGALKYCFLAARVARSIWQMRRAIPSWKSSKRCSAFPEKPFGSRWLIAGPATRPFSSETASGRGRCLAGRQSALPWKFRSPMRGIGCRKP